eukprot:Em0020g80a
MRHVPSAVVVVTTSDGVRKRGITSSSFASVSLVPPIVSFAVKTPSRMHNLLTVTQRFAIQVLAETQSDISKHFSLKLHENQDQFAFIPHSVSSWGLPIIDGCTATLQCEAESMHCVGDHHVWYGQVVDATSSNRTPLLYYARSYRTVGDHAFMKAFEDVTLATEDWTHEAHIRMAWNYLVEHGKQEAMPLIKYGIQKYTEQNKGKIKNVYNDTVTVFFIHMIDWAIQQFQGRPHTFEEFLQANPQLSDSKLIYKYYSEHALGSDQAKKRWIQPDIQPLP